MLFIYLYVFLGSPVCSRKTTYILDLLDLTSLPFFQNVLISHGCNVSSRLAHSAASVVPVQLGDLDTLSSASVISNKRESN
jgi:hypothetical protein